MSAPSTPQPRQTWVIGSNAGCDIVVQNGVVSGMHCLLAQYDEGFALEDLGSTNGTFVNGGRLVPRQPAWVQPQDTITLGRSLPFPWPSNSPGVSVAPLTSAVTREITIGRGPENGAVLDYSMISYQHARLFQDGSGRWFLEDLDSTNGTFLNDLGHRLGRRQPVEVKPSDSVYFGSYKVSVAKLLDRKVSLGEASGQSVMFQGDRMVVGRDPACDYPLDVPMVSWHHVELRRSPQGIVVRDLGSRNGTFVNGVRISGETLLKPGSELGLGSFRFTLLDAVGTLARRDYTGNVAIECVSLTVDIQKSGQAQRLLQPVSLTIFPSELVAIMGPAGAGKTTFLRALNGYTVPAYGRVLFNSADLYQYYDRFRLQLGYVPQDDIMHSLLTVEEALYFTAKLRTDLSSAEIRKRIQSVLASLNIDDIGQRQIGSPEKKVISGGQRKRVNIAMELLSDPNVLFLDEPTSGLSSYDALQVVQLLRRLANEGKTVILTIHQPSIDVYREFDNLIMISRDKGAQNSGALVYYGPAFPDSIEFFHPSKAKSPNASPELLLEGLAQRPTADWVGKYDQSRYKHDFVESRAGQNPAQGQTSKAPAVRKFGFTQWLTLVHRNAILKIRDSSQLVFMVLQALLFPIAMVGVFGDLSSVSDEAAAGKLSSVHFLLVVAAIWFGCNNAARDIVGEAAIFHRERMVSLKLPSYVFSKSAILAVICLLQCLMLLGIVHPFCGLKAPFEETLAVLFVASQAGAALGLLISSFAPSTESAIAVLPIPLLLMILLGGGIKPLHDMPQAAQELSKACASRWAFEANIVQESKRRPMIRPMVPNAPEIDVAEPVFPRGKRFQYEEDIAVLAGMSVAFHIVVLGMLRRRDVH